MLINCTFTSVRGVLNYGGLFDRIFIENISNVLVTRSGRVPIIFIELVPRGFNFETIILPVVESTLRRSVESRS